MNTSPQSTASHRQLLAHCLVSNDRGETSDRFIDHDQLELWQYLLQHRHALRVSHSRPCVWIPQDQCRRQPQRLHHTAFRCAVSRLEHASYDVDSGITRRRVRFVPTEEVAHVADILQRHFGADADHGNITVTAGMAISTMPTH